MTRPTTDSWRPVDGLDRAHGRFVGALDEQACSSERRRPGGGVGVAVDAVDVGGDVDVDDVAVLDHRIVRDTVADDLVERRAAGLREPLVAKRRRVGAVVDHVLVGDAVQLIGCHPGRTALPARASAPAAMRPATRIFSITSGVCTHGSLPSLAVGFHAYSGGAIDRGTGTSVRARRGEERYEQA